MIVKSRTPFEVTYRSLLKVGVAVFIFSILGKLIPLFLFLMIAVLIGVGLSTLVQYAKKHKIPVWISQTVITFGIVAFVVAIFLFLLPSIFNQISGFVSHLPEYRKNIEASIGSPGLKDFIHDSLEHAPDSVGSVPEKAALAGGMTMNFLYQFALLIILSIYFMVDGKRAYEWTLKMTTKYSSPAIKTRLDKTATEIRDVIFAYATGQILTCAFVAVYTYAVTRILHLPGALTLAAIATLCDLIPVIGFIVSLSISGLVAFTVSPNTALLIGVLYLAYSMIENYLIIPRVYGKTMNLSRLVVLLSILIGGKLSGIIGMFLILPVAGSWHAIEKYWIEPNFKRGETT
jgi:predicted PurR-regulated permease PerM